MGMRLTRLRGRLDEGHLGDVDVSLESLDRVVRQIRSTIRALRDPDEVTGLVERLHGEANRAHHALGFAPVLEVVDEALVDAQVPSDVADDVIAVVREGLSNAARHARAAEVGVRVAVDGTTLVVEVADDGRGLDPAVGRRSGLDNLVERARRHGGTSVFEARPDGGTVLRWTASLAD